MRNWSTKKASALRNLIAVFALLFAQVAVQAHAAEHGFEDHSHGGAPCIVAAVHDELDDGTECETDEIRPQSLGHSGAGFPPLDVTIDRIILLPPSHGPPALQ